MKMTSTTILAEEVLVFLTYGLDLLMRPTFSNWDDSYEGWLSRSGFLKRMHYLEKQKLLMREGKRYAWTYRLSETGRVLAAGGRDAEKLWARPWDGWWRQFVFDLPVSQQRARSALIRWLRRNGFGYLQDSVWITPDAVDGIAKTLKPFRDDAASFTVLVSRCAPGFSNGSLVEGAWPWRTIHEEYQRYLDFAGEATTKLKRSKLHPRDLFSWIREERGMWVRAFDPDPLLPRELLPKTYEGQRAWEKRAAVLSLLKRHIEP